jgi:hypothetical protein
MLCRLTVQSRAKVTLQKPNNRKIESVPSGVQETDPALSMYPQKDSRFRDKSPTQSTTDASPAMRPDEHN